MAKKATKALGNRYCQARLKAAEYNPDFAIRRTAAEHLPGVEEDSLKKYELDITRPPNTVIALMADAYNAPELREWYCANECPLGRDCREIEEMPAERTLIRLQTADKNLQRTLDNLAVIMQDGILDAAEAERAVQAREILLEMKRRIVEALAAIDKALRTGKF